MAAVTICSGFGAPSPAKIKMECRIFQKQKKGASESHPPINTPANFMYNIYGAHTCKYLIKWGNFSKRDLNLKWPNWDSFDITKLVFLNTQLGEEEKKKTKTTIRSNRLNGMLIFIRI